MGVVTTFPKIPVVTAGSARKPTGFSRGRKRVILIGLRGETTDTSHRPRSGRWDGLSVSQPRSQGTLIESLRLPY